MGRKCDKELGGTAKKDRILLNFLCHSFCCPSYRKKIPLVTYGVFAIEEGQVAYTGLFK